MTSGLAHGHAPQIGIPVVQSLIFQSTNLTVTSRCRTYVAIILMSEGASGSDEPVSSCLGHDQGRDVRFGDWTWLVSVTRVAGQAGPHDLSR